ncbi:reverse transcriptase family protein [Rhodopirellula sallentina]|uniref:RNA-directed DNA polymerase n=1 Tax=Rhodopirellula sallentina SM41 TaxID=1263870 RepID=M5TV13_9BACT|nr:reverse transcriptase family protein [Rhodopirellula sallentina]EMI53010.1 Retron-type reverse transcriptase [Rhodopirellula sallentina SM41]
MSDYPTAVGFELTQHSDRLASARLELSPRNERIVHRASLSPVFTMAPRPVVKRSVSAAELTKLLAASLSARWLGDTESVSRRLRKLTGSRAKWVQELAVSLNQQFGKQGYASGAEIIRHLRNNPYLQSARKNNKLFRLPVAEAISAPESDSPSIETDTQLVDFLGLPSLRALEWLLLPHLRRQTNVDHYTRRTLHQTNGKTRLIEEPRPVLKRVQRLILTEILSHVPIHDVAHAYRPERSVFTCAAPHTDCRVVLRMDIRDFFGTITLRRVAAQFRRCGYPRPIAFTLARLCTAATPITSESTEREQHLTIPHLPQGAPSSPTLANAVAFQLDRRLAGLTRAVDANYTRYADDLLFSGGQCLASRVDRIATTVAVIAMEEGFQIAHRKTRTMFSGHQQRVLGLTVNQKLNCDRRQYELLRAILTNCLRHGWESQNRDSHPNFAEHLRGRIAQIVQANPNRGQRLLHLYEQVSWNDPG